MRRLWLVALAVAVVAGVAAGAGLPHRRVKDRVADLTSQVAQAGKQWDNMPTAIESVIRRVGTLATGFSALIETVGAYPGGNAVEDVFKADVVKLRANAVEVKRNMEALKAAHAAVEKHGAAKVKAKLAELDQ